MVKKAMIVGATSGIAEAVIHEMAKNNYMITLVGRNSEKLQTLANHFKVIYQREFYYYVLDMNDMEKYQNCITEVTNKMQGLDVVFMAHGTLSDQKKCEHSVELTLQEFKTNLLSMIAFLTLVANYFEQQKSGVIAVISSCAGDRGRQSNYVYGAAKAGLSFFLQGLRNRLYKSNVHVLTIKPGFIDTPMTVNFKKGLLWVKPDCIATQIVKAIENKKDIIYTPRFWWGIMLIIKSIPEKLFKRLSL